MIAVWPMALYAGLVVLVVGSMIGVSALLGERHHGRATGEPYEAGIPATGSARLRFPSTFYLIAMFFVVFDVESVFLFAWAVAAREVGWAGYAEMVVFVGILVVALVYLWRIGALEQRGPGRPLPRRPRQQG
jgi:NADH-quinone oxidoreductase subunit A